MNDSARTACPAATPVNPVSSSGRRLIRPISTIPRIVPMIATTPTVMVRISDALAPRPVDSRIVGA
jgi:hypothetical protein